MSRISIGLLGWLLAACAAAEGAGDRFVVDTLPSGALRVTSDAPNGWRDSTRAWRLVEDGRFAGAEGTDAALNEPQSLAVDALGRVYVADRKPTIIKVFSPDGSFLRTVGREGAGPGEFRVAFLAAWRDRLVVHDPQQSRTSVFDTAGAFLTSWHSACCYWTDIGVDSAGRIYVPSPTFGEGQAEAPAQPWLRFRMDGSVVDTLRLPPWKHEGKAWTLRAGSGRNQMMMQLGVPFSPDRQYALHPDGGFVYGWSGAYELAVSPRGQDTSLVIRRAWTAEPIPDPMRVAVVEENIRNVGPQFPEAELRATFRIEDVPTATPAFMSIAVDPEGHVWARRLLGSDSTRTTWDVFDRRGVWLGPVTAPAKVGDYGARTFARGAIYTAIEDDDGRPVVVRYRVAR